MVFRPNINRGISFGEDPELEKQIQKQIEDRKAGRDDRPPADDEEQEYLDNLEKNKGGGSGGGSGGGNIVIAHRGTYTNNGSVSVAGGTAGSVGGTTYARVGGNGGLGSAQVLQIL